MKKIKTALLVLTLVFGVSLFTQAQAANLQTNQKTGGKVLKVAVVDVPAVVESSAQVKALRKEQQQKLAELQKWLETVKADVDKQKTKEDKEKLVKKYDADFAKKQEAIRTNYVNKLKAIDANISGVINSEAKAMGYDIILAKGVVLFGGDDITASISKKVK